jgi:hypothetical protein
VPEQAAPTPEPGPAAGLEAALTAVSAGRSGAGHAEVNGSGDDRAVP